MAEPLFTDHALQEQYRELMRDTAGAPHLDEAAWERLAAGGVDAGDRDARFDHIVACERCAAIWRGVLALREAAETDGLLPPEAPVRPGLMRAPFIGLAIAATLVIVSGAIVMRQMRDPQPAAAVPPAAVPPAATAPYLAAFPITKADIHVAPEEALAPRGSSGVTGEPPIDQLAAALAPYRAGDFAGAVKTLTPLVREYPRAGRPALYLGVALLHLDRAADAVAPLTAALDSPIAAVAADARWYRAVAYARSQQREAAAVDVRLLCAAGAADSARACQAEAALSSARP